MRPSGAHFPDEQWVDYVRDLLPAGDQAVMREHLESGCASCAETWRLFGAMYSGAALRIEVPEQLTAAAIAIFQPPGAEPDWIEKLIPLVPRLTFGAELDWQPAGVRGASGDRNRLVYQAGDYSVDLSLEAQDASDRPEMVGQISLEQDPETSLGSVIVQVLAAGKAVSETTTNRFGEFMIELPARNYTVLRFALKHQGHRIDLPLKMPIPKWRLP